MRFFKSVLFLVAFYSGHSQSISDFDYINYLIRNKQPRDAIFFLNQIDVTKAGSAITDSANHYYGMSHYELKHPDTSAIYLGKVSAISPLFVKSRLYQSINQLYTADFEGSKRALLTMNVDTSNIFKQQKELQLCGTYLLERNIKAADSLATSFSLSNYLFIEEQKELKQVLFKMQHQKNKKPLTAAFLSTLVPGLGKYYAGRKGQAFASFFSTFGLALITTENLYRGGVKSPQFIFTGAVFSLFYLGNIFGSAYSVKMAKKQQALLLDNEIKSAIHKPLRRIFY